MSEEEIKRAKLPPATMSEEYPGLTLAEVDKAKEAARAKIEAARKKAMIANITATEEQRLAREEGFTSGVTEMDEIVHCTIDLAPYVDRVLINGAPYMHGHTYTVQRHVATTLQDICSRTWRHQDEIDGKSLTEHMMRPRDTVISALRGVSNSPSRPA